MSSALPPQAPKKSLRRTAKPSKNQNETDKLAKQLATSLTISSSKGKQRAETREKTPEEHKAAVMRTVNEASKGLSDIMNCSWKKGTSKHLPTGAPDPVRCSQRALEHLAILRKLCPDDWDIERVAISILGKLAALHMHMEAYDMLRQLHPALCNLLSADIATRDSSHSAALVSLPLPERSIEQSSTNLQAIGTYLAYSLYIICNLFTSKCTPASLPSISKLSRSLAEDTALLTWIPHLTSLPVKMTDSILTRAYRALSTLTAEISPSTATDARASFQIRVYSLKCILTASSETLNKPDSFWDQVVRSATSYARFGMSNSPLTDNERNEMLEMVSSSFDMLVSLAERRPDSQTFTSGKGYLAFCECWIDFAKKLRNHDLLEKIVSKMGSGASSSRSPSDTPNTGLPSPKESPAAPADIVLESTQLCGTFSQVLTLLEKPDEKQDRERYVTELIDGLGKPWVTSLLGCPMAERDGSVQRISGKLERYIEKTTRASARLLEQQTSQLSDNGNAQLRRLLECLTDMMRTIHQRDAEECSMTQVLLHGLFTLARISLVVHDPSTYATCHDILLRATTALGIEDLPQNLNTLPLAHANLVRCLAGAFHNIAGALYKEGKHASAIPFLKPGCELAWMALKMLKAGQKERVSEVGVDFGKEDGWKQLEEQFYRRYQLLGACYFHIGDRKDAFDSFIESIRHFPYAAAGMTDKAKQASCSAVFDGTHSGNDLGNIIDRVSYLGACELFLPSEQVSLRSIGIDEPAIAGILLERQFQGLEAIRHKENILPLMCHILKDAIEIYELSNMPLRQTRVILRSVELAYHAGPEHTALLGTLDELQMTLNGLLSREDVTFDNAFNHLRSQYRATALIWCAIHAHRRADPQQYLLISQSTSQACEILRGAIVPDIKKSVSVKKSSPKQKKKKQTPQSGKVSSKKDVKSPRTPKREPLRELRDVPLQQSNFKEAAVPAQTIDDVEGLTKALNILSAILGFHSLDWLRLSVLDMIRLIYERSRDTSMAEYMASSSEFACEYLKLGKVKRSKNIFHQVQSTIENEHLPFDVQVSFLLKYAETCAAAGIIEESVIAYCRAKEMEQRILDVKSESGTQRILSRVTKLERAAIATKVFASIQHTREDTHDIIDALLSSLHLWTRAYDSLARFHPPTTPQIAEESNPFADSPQSESEDRSSIAHSSFTKRPSMSGFEWRIAQGLLTTMFTLQRMYFVRGSVREAEYFCEQAEDFSCAINAPAMAARARSRKGELQLAQGRLEEGLESLVKAEEYFHDESGLERVDANRLLAEYSQRLANYEDAHQKYTLSVQLLDELDQTFGQLEGATFGPRKSLTNSSSSGELLLPDLRANLLRRCIWLLRDSSPEEYTALTNAFMALPPVSTVLLEENRLTSRLSLYNIIKHFHGDIFLNSIADSTISVPLRAPDMEAESAVSVAQDAMRSLEQAERLFLKDLETCMDKGDVPHVRESLVSLALVKAFQTSLGRCENQASLLVANLLDDSSVITLRREMLEAIHMKSRKYAARDDLLWRSIRGSEGPCSPKATSDHLQNLLMTDESNTFMTDYWNALKTKYQTQTPTLETMSSSRMASIPSHWTVVHITIGNDNNSLFISRQRGGDVQHPLVFCIPLKNRRESSDDDEEYLAYGDAINEMEDIIRLNNETTKAAINVKEREAKMQWWKERRTLDRRLRDLLENIEFCWLGAFKTILSRRPKYSSDVIPNLRLRFDKVFQQGLHLQDRKTKLKALGHKRIASDCLTPNRITLNDALVECFSTLSPRCKDEELEDMVYFILDLYQFYGVPVVISEIDVDQVVIDLRSVLEEHAANMAKASAPSIADDDEHLFLILDKNIQGLPWESIPILRGRSVSRVPSLDFLLDRIELARRQLTRHTSAIEKIDRAVINPRKGYYILNPSGDLGRTEGRFKDWLKEMENVGWRGLIGTPPSELQMQDALSNNDLVVYFGHGGAEQYIRSHAVKSLSRCAAVMLWGCSSGHLKLMGDFDRIGTPFNYMVAGCPSLVVNLWDVTDGDIDKFTQSVVDKLHLNPSALEDWTYGNVVRGRKEETSVVAAVAQSRDSCKLKYLTGAAPVVYGIPFYL